MSKDFVLVGGKANLHNFLHLIEAIGVRYLIVETEYTINHFEVLLASCKDRGSFKWIAETKKCAYLDGMRDEGAKKAHIDSADLFPRIYFHADSVAKEFELWCAVRDQNIQMIKVPIYYSPGFDSEFYMNVINEALMDSEC